MLIDDFRTDFARYKQMGEQAMAQMTDDALNVVPPPDGNSVAMIVRHISGNLVSRFTDFLTTDGEKPNRHRDDEFETQQYTRAQVQEIWERGWRVVLQTLSELDDSTLQRTVSIRQEQMTVHRALTRSLAHIAYHVGQIVLLGKTAAGDAWKTLSIPKRKHA